jgi:hypothetical protein
MRRQFVSLTFAVLSVLPPVVAAAPGVTEDSRQATVAVQRVSRPFSGMRDEAAMVLIGTALIALAAAVKRAEWITTRSRAAVRR